MEEVVRATKTHELRRKNGNLRSRLPKDSPREYISIKKIKKFEELYDAETRYWTIFHEKLNNKIWSKSLHNIVIEGLEQVLVDGENAKEEEAKQEHMDLLAFFDQLVGKDNWEDFKRR